MVREYFKLDSVAGQGDELSKILNLLHFAHDNMRHDGGNRAFAEMDAYECHVINTVWSEQLQKWLYIDPTMDAWVMDENGTMLSIAEVRDRLKNDLPLVLCETANWNHENQQTKAYYLDYYMAKNLYYFVAKP